MSTEMMDQSDDAVPKAENEPSRDIMAPDDAGIKNDDTKILAADTAVVVKTGNSNGTEENTATDVKKTDNHHGGNVAAARTDHQNDIYEIKVKAEYVCTERPSSLPPLPGRQESSSGGGGVEEEGDADGGDNRDRRNNKGKKKQKGGMNRKRPRDEKQDASEKICLAIIRGTTCPYGAEDCRFSHDVKAYMATRPPDITTLEGGCPNYQLHGKCIYGAMCRFGSSHINMSTGQNLEKATVPPPPADDDNKSSSAVVPPSLAVNPVNILPKDVQFQLRKKTYPFKCKRFFEKAQQDDNKSDNAATTTTASSSTPVELKTRKIIDFSNKVYVAPLTTVGNLPFRRIMKKYGADITCGEMALATCLLEGKPSEWALLKRHPEEDVFGVQLAAAHPDQYTRVTELIEELATVDFVDLNLGCPLDLVCNKGAGAKLMLRENKLRESLRGISHALSCPITIKIRTGWDMNKPFAHKLVPKIQSWGIDGVSAIMIHGRSRLQRYQKEANWNYISEVANSQSPDMPKIPIIGNGDVFSYKDYEEKIAHEGVSPTAMLGRGALIKPWLPTEIKERRHWDISASERLDILKDFVRFGLEHWGSDQQGVNNTRRFLLEWLSFLHRYVPVGLLEVVPQQMNQRPPNYLVGRNDLETLFLSPHSSDWVKIAEMLLGPVPDDFRFEPKHKAKGYA